MSTRNDGYLTDYVTDGFGDPPCTVLVAEDDADMRETLCLWLEREGPWDPIPVRDGREAMASLDASVDTLLLDRRMPELSGPELVDRLDETEFDGPVVVVSAYEPDEHLSGDDVAAYLVKPVDPVEVVEALERAVSAVED